MEELEIGKQYSYKSNVYEILNFGRMKTEKGEWIDSVIYQKVSDEGVIYTRSRKSFENLFIPHYLEIGDEVIGISMNKVICILKVLYTDNKTGRVSYRYADNTDSSLNNEICELTTNNVINANGSLEVIDPDDRFSHINCLEYYILSNSVNKILNRKSNIDKIRSNLMLLNEAFGNIPISYFENDSYLTSVITI